MISQFCQCRLILYFIIYYLDLKPKRYTHELFQKHIHKVKFYPSTGTFTQALLVMLVTNITSGPVLILILIILIKHDDDDDNDDDDDYIGPQLPI